MVGKNNKKKAPASVPVNGLPYVNGFVQNGSRDSEDQNANIRAYELSTSSGTENHVSEVVSENQAPHEPMASCSVEAQTDFTRVFVQKAPEDGLINFVNLSPWSQVETFCEIVKILDPRELRLLSACIEGAARSATALLKRQENNANNSHFIQQLTDGRRSYPDAVKETFELICLLQSSNRPTAFFYTKLIDQLMLDRKVQLSLLPDDIKQATLQNLGKLVTAALHHPAFSVPQCMRLENARDELLSEYANMHPAPTQGAPGIPTTPAPLTYIKRIVASPSKDIAGITEYFSIELQWNDGQVTWVNRGRKEISALHSRLLDAFGDERREEAPSGTIAVSSAPQQNLNSALPSRNQGRILPYFNNELTDPEIVEYLNGLSDLPARMMLSSVIYEEFYASRQQNTTELIERSCSPTPPNIAPLTAHRTFLMSTTPLSYSVTNNGRLLVNAPSCSNCAGEHSFVLCPQKTLLAVQSEKDGFRALTSPPEDPEGGNGRHHIPFPPPGLPIPPAFPPGATPVVYNHQPDLPYYNPGQLVFVMGPHNTQ